MDHENQQTDPVITFAFLFFNLCTISVITYMIPSFENFSLWSYDDVSSILTAAALLFFGNALLGRIANPGAAYIMPCLMIATVITAAAYAVILL